MSVLLEGAGFQVVETRNDLSNIEMRRVIRDFSEKTRDADMAVMFYAGHGIEVDGSNFLISTDAKLERDIDIEDEAIALDRVVGMLEPVKKLRLVILDACRDNPFARTMKRTMVSRAIGSGLAKVEPPNADTLIAFAAKAGSVAADGDGLPHGADLAVVYYAGHGIEIGGSNYLVPVDAVLARDIDVEDETVSLDRLLTVLEPAKGLRLVILDACRDNPFVGAMKRTMVSRSIGRGLARIEPIGSDTLVAFAAKAGSTAADGESLHSPFTAALLQHIATPGLDLRIAFGRAP